MRNQGSTMTPLPPEMLMKVTISKNLQFPQNALRMDYRDTRSSGMACVQLTVCS